MKKRRKSGRHLIITSHKVTDSSSELIDRPRVGPGLSNGRLCYRFGLTAGTELEKGACRVGLEKGLGCLEIPRDWSGRFARSALWSA